MEIPRSSGAVLHRDYHRYGLIAVTALLVSAPFAAGAHGAGAFFETLVGDYIVDIGFSTPAPEAGESVIFDFQLRGADTTLTSGSDTEYSDVWVRIESQKGTVFASGIHNAEFGGPRMSYMFPGPGTYTISARYEEGTDTLAETSFPMTVIPSSSGSFWERIPHWEGYFGGLIGLLLGGLLVRTTYLRR